MKKRNLISLLLPLVLMQAPARAADDVLAHLRPGHPRLLVLDADIAKLKEEIKTDPTAKKYFDQIKKNADGMLTAPVSTRVLVGPRLLFTSRNVLIRTSTLGGIYRLTGDRKYADRCRDEMLAAARFSDWNPSHFLDVAEMTNALAVGYDWIFDVLTPAERTEIQNAIVHKGLDEGLKVYASTSPTAWPKRVNNWNQVCNGGLTVGALAVADVDPDTARKVIEAGRASIPLAMHEFAPDGGCVEGPGYWAYATLYNVFYLAALHTALDTDFGLNASPGFSHTGDFRIVSLSPTKRTFNFADAHDGITPAPQMFWLARTFDQPAYAAHERAITPGIDPFHLLWFNPAGSPKDVEKLEKSALFRRLNVVFLRTGDGVLSSFVGFKGGDNAVNHSHLDLGSFVYDTQGTRWALDLGPDDYNLPGYFGNQRWTYYRLQTQGHNTLTINQENQDPKGAAKITTFDPEKNLAIADLSKANPKSTTHWLRGLHLLPNGSLLIQDELQTKSAAEVTWHLHTAAKIQLTDDPHQATLTQGTKRLQARILEPQNAKFATAESDPEPSVESTVPSGHKRTPGQKLVVKITEPTTTLRLVIQLLPEGAEPAGKVEPLSAWK